MAGKRLDRSIRAECKDDINALPTLNLKRRAVQIFVDVSSGDLEGTPLEDHPAVGELCDCRKVYFDEDDDRKPRFRLVYRLLPNGVDAVRVEAIAVGLRAAMPAYVDAARRLGKASMAPSVTVTAGAPVWPAVGQEGRELRQHWIVEIAGRRPRCTKGPEDRDSGAAARTPVDRSIKNGVWRSRA